MSKIRSRAFLFLEKELAKQGIKDLSPSHGDILYAVSVHQPMGMRELAARTGRDKSTLTPLVNRLIRHGYLSRLTSSTDRRRAEIRLTKKASALVPLLVHIGLQLEKRMLGDIAPIEAEKLVSALLRIQKNLES